MRHMSEGTKKPFPPLILGILTAPMLADCRYPEDVWICGGIELRADGLPLDAILPALEAFVLEKKKRGFEGLVFFTLRLQRDGGAWENSRSRERESLWFALAGMQNPPCDFLDIEIEEVASLGPKAWNLLRENGLQILLSHHSFVVEKPSDWEAQLVLMNACRPDAVKFAVTVDDSTMAASLLGFARKVAEKFPLSCVLGMGEAGCATRVTAPLLGCPITYAFLGDRAVAPGQLSVKNLRTLLMRVEERPAPDASEEQWIKWAEKGIREIQRVA